MSKLVPWPLSPERAWKPSVATKAAEVGDFSNLRVAHDGASKEEPRTC